MKRNNIHDYILALCVSSRKGDLAHPFTRQDKVYATNSFLAVRMPKDRPSVEYTEGKTEAEQVFPKEETTDATTIKIETSELLGIVSAYGFYINKRKNCEACHGSGEDECFHCGHESECESCQGSGQQGEEIPALTFTFRDQTMELNGKHFTPAYLHIVALIGAVLGEKEIVLDCRGSKAHVDYSDGTEVILMLQHRSK